MDTKKPMSRLWQSVIVLAIAAILSTGMLLIKSEEYRDWQPADGIVTNLRQHTNLGIGSGRSCLVDYLYEANGVTYTGFDSFRGNIPDGWYIGMPAEVWYNPDYPSHSMFYKPEADLWILAPFCLAVPVLAFVLSGGFRRQDRRLGSI